MAGRGVRLLLIFLYVGVKLLQATNTDKVPIIRQKIDEIRDHYIKRDLDTDGLDQMATQIDLIAKNQEDGGEIKLEKAGVAINELLGFFTSLKNGEFKGDDGGGKAAVSIAKLVGRFAEIGGAFLPPPAGTALTVGFDAINSLMSLIGVAPEAPSMREVMSELLDKQTEEIRSMFEGITDAFWNELKDKADGEIAKFEKTHTYLREALILNYTEAEVDITLKTIGPIFQGTEFLVALKNKMEEICESITSKNEERCILVLEYFSRISTLRSSLRDMQIGVQKLYHKNLATTTRKIAEQELEEVKKTLNTVSGREKISATCLKKKIASSSEDELVFTKTSMKTANQSYELSETEQTMRSMICPSDTKLLLIAGHDENEWNSVELVSPFSNSHGSFHVLPEWRDDWPMASVYTTSQGEKRVMVCGGDYSKREFHNIQSKCWSSNGGKWKNNEPSLLLSKTEAGMASINKTIYVLGGRRYAAVKQPLNTINEFHEGRGWSRSNFVSPVKGAQCSVSWEDMLYTVDYRGQGAHYASVRDKIWYTLPSPPHEAYRCTVAIMSSIISCSFQSLGCWKDKSNRAIETLEGMDSRLKGNYWERQKALQTCFQVAIYKGYSHFAVQNGGQCAGSSTTLDTMSYKKYGKATVCSEGTGGQWANDVYSISCDEIQKVNPVWVISEANGDRRISYLPLPYTPSSQWMPLPDLPGSCTGLGWSEGRLICAEALSDKIHYYDGTTWKTATHRMKKSRKGNAYANVPGSWGYK